MTKNNKTVPVELGGRDFVIRRIPMARVRKIGATLSKIIGDFTKLDLNENEDATQVIIDKALEFPYEILSLFIKDLPKDIFEDEDNGVDFPEFLEALEKAIEINRIDTLKNFFSRLVPMLTTAQASLSQKAN